MEYILAHDIGTSGNKAVITDKNGRIVGSAFEEYGVEHPKLGWAEQAPETWWKAIVHTTSHVMKSSGVSPDDIIGISFSSQMLGVLPVDEDGRALRPCIIWLDCRAGEQAQQIIKKFSATLIRSMYGVLPSGKDVIPKIMWVRDKEPEIFKKAYKIIDCGSYVVHKFTGEFKMDFSCASVTGLLDNKKKTWSKMFSGVLGLPVEKFCTAVKSTELVGGVTKETALETGLKEGTPVFCGCGDAAASAVGSGAVRANHANIYIGTSGWVEVTVDKPVVIKKGGIATICAADQGKWLLIAETESAGACLKWFGDVLGGEERAEAEKSGESIYRVFDRIAEGVEPGSKSLIFTPWMFGERAPICDENVRGGFINLSLDHRREHMIRAIMEGVAYHNAWMLEAIENKIGIESMNATGGGARSKVWLQMIADVTGKTVKQTASPLDGCSIGAALTAAVGLGIYRDFDSLEGVIPMAGEFHPREENRMKYAVLYENFKKVYEGLAGLYCSLNKCE